MKHKRKRLLEQKEILHQHKGEDGTVFGQSHPVKFIHKNTTTWKAHNRTILLDQESK